MADNAMQFGVDVSEEVASRPTGFSRLRMQSPELENKLVDIRKGIQLGELSVMREDISRSVQVAWLVLGGIQSSEGANHPQPRRHFGLEFLVELGKAVTWIEENASRIKLVFICNLVGDFLLGWDPALLLSLEGKDMEVVVWSQLELLERIAALRPLTVAAITGPCYDCGFELALACDVRLASHGVRLGVQSFKLFSPPVYAMYRLPELVGVARALDLLLSHVLYTGYHAWGMGIVGDILRSANISETNNAVLMQALQQSARKQGVRQFKLRGQLPSGPCRWLEVLLHTSTIGRSVWQAWYCRKRSKLIRHAEWMQSMMGCVIRCYNADRRYQMERSAAVGAQCLLSGACRHGCRQMVKDNSSIRNTLSQATALGKPFGVTVAVEPGVQVGLVYSGIMPPVMLHAVLSCGFRAVVYRTPLMGEKAQAQLKTMLCSAMASMGMAPQIVEANVKKNMTFAQRVEDLRECQYVVDLRTEEPVETKRRLYEELSAATQAVAGALAEGDVEARTEQETPQVHRRLLMTSIVSQPIDEIVAKPCPGWLAVGIDHNQANWTEVFQSKETHPPAITLAVGLLQAIRMQCSITQGEGFSVRVRLIDQMLASCLRHLPPGSSVKDPDSHPDQVAMEKMQAIDHALDRHARLVSPFTLAENLVTEAAAELKLPQVNDANSDFMGAVIRHKGLVEPSQKKLRDDVAQSLADMKPGPHSPTSSNNLVEMVAAELLLQGETMVEDGVASADDVDMIGMSCLNGAFSWAGGLMSLSHAIQTGDGIDDINRRWPIVEGVVKMMGKEVGSDKDQPAVSAESEAIDGRLKVYARRDSISFGFSVLQMLLFFAGLTFCVLVRG